MIFIALIFLSCQVQEKEDDVKDLNSVFNVKYTKTISQTSWEQVRLREQKQDSYVIEFANISTGKTQTCTLYSRGIFLENNLQSKNLKLVKSEILLRPNKAKDITLEISKSLNGLNIKISDIAKFINLCGEVHQYAVGSYTIAQ